MIFYTIIPLADLTRSMINLSLITSVNSVRVNNLNTEGLIKFDTSSDLSKETFASYVWYNKIEILNIINTDAEWISE